MNDILWFKMYVSESVLVGHFRDFLRKMLQNKFINILQYKDSIVLGVGEEIIVKCRLSTLMN